MKIFDIALKDMTRSFRSWFLLAFMFGVPILMTAMFFVMFGGTGGDDDAGFGLPATEVRFVNLDKGMDLGGQTMNMGGLIAEVFEAEDVMEYIIATQLSDPAAARAAVDSQEAGVAVIIPENFTEAVIDPQGEARVTVELYQDPTLTLGPSVVKAIISSFMDSFSGTRIAANTLDAQLVAAEVSLDDAQMQAVLAQYIQWMQALGESRQASGLLDVVPPPGKEATASTSMTALMLTTMMTGMTVFYAFFTGTGGAQALLEEEEKGTLPRLFSTPTPVRDVLTGRFLANAATILVQMIVLVIFGKFIFGLNYGDPLNIAVAILGGVLTATSFGIFVISWVKDAKQAGVIFGGVVTVTGMFGMVDIFTMSIPNPSSVVKSLPLFVPQGWVMRLWKLSMDGADFSKILLVFGGILVWNAVLFGVGWARFNRRYA